MTATTAVPLTAPADPRIGLRSHLRHIGTLVRRNLVWIRRDPESMFDAVLFPGGYRWRDSVAKGGIEATRLVSGIIPLLVVAGCLEGFFSPSHAPVWLKFTVGAVLFGLLNLWLWRPVKARGIPAKL